MPDLTETVIDLFTAASATTLSEFDSHALPVSSRIAGYLISALVIGWGLCYLEGALPRPTGRQNTMAAGARRLLIINAGVWVFSAFFISRGMKGAGQAVDQTLSRFEQNLTGPSERGWQREAFSLAAERIAQLGPEHAKMTEQTRRGGLHLLLPDTASAKVLQAAVKESTLKKWEDETTWLYRLWRGLSIGEKGQPAAATASLPVGSQTLGSDPAASPLIKSAIAEGVAEIRQELQISIARHLSVNEFQLWMPAIIAVTSAFLAQCATASLRFGIRFLKLEAMP